MEQITPTGLVCQSCGMPLKMAEDFGTDEDGLHVIEFCRYCFEGGRFTQPDISIDEMIQLCADIIVEQGSMPRHEARDLMADMLPQLKRWKR